MQAPRVLLITDASFPDAAVLRAIREAARVIPAGAFAVQLRDKTRPDRAAWGRTLREVTRSLGVPFVVNGDVALARELDAEGVHFPARWTHDDFASARGLWRSVVAHDDDEVRRAADVGASAVLVSPVFASPGKAAPRGVAAVARAVELGRGALAVIALGGIGVADVRACVLAGAHGVAVIRALLAADRPALVAEEMMRAMLQGSGAGA